MRLLALGFEVADALADKDRIDASLDCGELSLDALLDFAYLLGDPRALVVVAVFHLARQHRTLSVEVGEAVRAEDP